MLGSTQAMFQILELQILVPALWWGAPQLKRLVKNHDGPNLRFKQYPLSNICNPNIGHDFIKCVQRTAATECANLQEKFGS